MRASRPEITAPSRRALRAPFVAVLLLAGVAGLGLRWVSDWAAPATAWAAPAKAPAHAAPVKASAPAKAQAPAPMPAKPAAVKPAPTSAPAASNSAPSTPAPVAATPVAMRPTAVVPAAPAPKPAVVSSLPTIEESVTYQYNALGRRDPFSPMAGGPFVGEDVGGDAPPDVGGIKVVGVVWGANDKFALVEDARGTSRVLRAGDKVMNGVVETLKRDAVIVKMTVDGQTETVAIPLTRKGDQTNANR